MSLSTLPAEILDRICTYSESDDIPKIRETANVLAQVGFRHLAREVTFDIFGAGVVYLLSLSLHPIHNNVKAIKIVWSKSSKHSVRERIERALEFSDTARIFRELSKIYKLWSFTDLEKSGFPSTAYVTCLKTLIPTFPSLESIFFDDLFLRMPETYQKLDPEEYEEYLNLFRQGNFYQILGRGLEQLQETVALFFAPKLLDSILTACADSPRSHRSQGFHLRYNFLPFGFLDPSDYSRWNVALQRLTSLDLRRFAKDGDRDPYHWWERRNLGSFIAKLSNLEQLSLSMGRDESPFPLCQKGTFFQHLKVLKLDGLCLAKHEIKGFLDRHGPRLQRLSLTAINLLYDDDWNEGPYDWNSWVSLLSQLKDSSLSGLQDFCLSRTLDSNDDYDLDNINKLKNQFNKKLPLSTTIPPNRSIRYLMCQRTTDNEGKVDAVSRLEYNWDSITWSSVRRDLHSLEKLRSEARKQECGCQIFGSPELLEDFLDT